MSRLESPAALARPVAEDMVLRGMLDEFNQSPEEALLLENLERDTAEKGLFDTSYLVESVRSAIIPTQIDKDTSPSVHLFNDLAFEGKFLTYSTVRMGRMMGFQSMRALCLTFDRVTLLPYLDSIGENRLLHVPVLAVSDMVPTA